MSAATDSIAELVKALEAGNYNAAPSKLAQGCGGLIIEAIDAVFDCVIYDDKHINLQKVVVAGGAFVATGSNGEVATSSDGYTWTTRSDDIDFDLFRGKADFNPPIAPAKICECGAAKTGIKAYSPGHSSWCPVVA